MEILDRQLLVEHLRNALRHLYDANYLRSSPLAQFFGVSNRIDTSSTIRSILIDSINAFKPDPDEPDQSRTWRIFDSLYCCFVQQLKQQIVADQLSISPRQLRREQTHAIEALADELLKKYIHDESATQNTSSTLQTDNSTNSKLADELRKTYDVRTAIYSPYKQPAEAKREIS